MNSEKMPEPPPPNERRLWEIDFPLPVLAILLLLGILQYWVIGYLGVHLPDRVGLASYLSHWSSVGGLIGLAVSRNKGYGTLIGATIGAIVSDLLIC